MTRSPSPLNPSSTDSPSTDTYIVHSPYSDGTNPVLYGTRQSIVKCPPSEKLPGGITAFSEYLRPDGDLKDMSRAIPRTIPGLSLEPSILVKKYRE